MYAHPTSSTLRCSAFPTTNGKRVRDRATEAGPENRSRRAARSWSQRLVTSNRAYEIREELPRTDSGKLLKRVLATSTGSDAIRAV